MRQNGNGRRWVLVAAVGATMMMAGSATAQVRVGDDGRARDANNRIGGGGLNEGGTGQQLPYGYLGNKIVTGNVTGGRQFRGFVPYSDPNVFHGVTAGSLSDEFIKNSSGAPYGGVASDNANTVRPFYGESRVVSPPPGFVQESPGAGYVPAPMLSRQPGDLRLGQTLEQSTVLLPQPGQLNMAGPVDPNTGMQMVIAASPLFGVRLANPGDQAGGLNINTPFVGSDQEKLNLMQRELQSGEQNAEPKGTGTETTGQDQQGNTQGLNDAMGFTLESPENKALGGSLQLEARAGGTGTPLNSNLATGQGTQQRNLTLVRPERQSRTYAELQNRLKQYRAGAALVEAADKARAHNEQLPTQEKKTEPAPGQPPAAATPQGNAPGTPGAPPVPGTATPGTAAQGTQAPQQPGGIKLPGVPQPEPKTGTQGLIPGSVTQGGQARPKPLQVPNLHEGLTSKALAEVIKEAEDQMRAGRYNSALEQFELAEQAAPNNPLIQLGKANAELGQSYYSRAEQHLRQAFMSDQALLMGQYDLKSMLGQERLDFLVRDLKEIAKTNKSEARPLFLLAYIAYNTGNERHAAAYLDLAEARSGGNDPLYPLLRKYWVLPADTGGPEGAGEELNK